MTLSHLQHLEAESIHIMREVVAESDNPVMLYSIGKDSATMLHLALKAFHPAKPPFPLLHVDTGWKFRDMYAFRDRITAELGLDLLVHINREGVAQGINPFTHGSAIHTDIMKTGENIRRIAEVARLMVDAGLIVLTAFISPFRSERRMARELLADDEFIEIFVDTPIAIAEERDPKGLYKKARGGELKNFTGIDSPYEEPENPEIRIETRVQRAEAAADQIVAFLERRVKLSGA
jgi:hypothetical protein